MSDTSKYFKKVKSSFQTMGKKEREYLRSLKKQLEEAERFSYEECIKVYGEPKDIVAAYYENEGDMLIKKIKYKKYITVAAAIIIIAVFVILFIYYKAYQDSANTIPDRVEIIIGEE